MIGRSTVYNRITSPNKINEIDEDNLTLIDDFANYLASVDRSPKTISQYKSDLKIFFTWNLEFNKNKKFPKITKRDLSRFQAYAIDQWQWSSNRTRRVKSALSSLSTFVENILDEEDEFKNFKSIVRKIETPPKEPVRKKTILTDEHVNFLLDTLIQLGKYEELAAIAILACSGMRKAELLQMKMEYFTPEHLKFNSLYITEDIRAKGKGKKGKQVPKYVMKKVDKYIDLWRKEREKLGIESEWVFVTKDRKGGWRRRLSIDRWTSFFSEILNVPFYYHCLRHKLCTDFVSEDVPADVIRDFFKWDSADMINIYNDSTVADSLGKYFSEDGIITQKPKNISDIK